MWIYQLSPFPSQTSFRASCTLLFFFIYLSHQFLTTYAFFQQHWEIVSFMTQYTVQKLIPPEYSVICYISTPVIILISVSTAIYNKGEYSGIRYLLAWIGTRVLPGLRLLLQINVVVSAMFVMIDRFCFILFIIAAVVNLLATFLLQNYTLKKDYLKCCNITFSLLWRAGIYLYVTVNQSLLWYQSEMYFYAVIVLRFAVVWTVYVFYVLKGYNIYRKQWPRFILAANLVVLVCAATGQFIDQMVYILGLHMEFFDYAYLGAIYTPICLFTYAVFRYRMSKSCQSQQNHSNLKHRIEIFQDQIASFGEDIQVECFMRGLVRDHWTKKCANPACFSRSEWHYDSKSNKEVSIKRIGVHKSIYSKLLIRCWYEEKTQETVGEKIDFAEFMFLRLRNTFRSMKMLEEVRMQFLFPIDKLRIDRLRKEIEKDNVKLNGELYNGQLDIEFVIEGEKTFEGLKTSIATVLGNNKAFWTTVYNNRVDLTQLLQTVKPNFAFIETINNEWQRLAGYFDVQHKWRFFYAWYTLYVRNEKLMSVLLEQLTTEVKEEAVFGNAKEEYKEGHESEIVFSGFSAVLHVSWNADQCLVKKVSSSFTKLFGYSQADILESPLEVLMSRTLAGVHNKLFQQWGYQGRQATEANYRVRKVFVKHKMGRLVAATKHLKQLITLTGELQYIALLKTNQEQENMLLTDSSLGVEGMTDSLFKSLKLAGIGLDHDSLQTLNLTFIAPKLLTFLCGDDQDNQVNNRKKPRFRRKASFKPLRSEKSISARNISSGKETDMRCEINIPSNLKEVVTNYKGDFQRLSNTDKFCTVEQIQDQFNEARTTFRFTCRLIITPKILFDKRYYQVEVRDLLSMEATGIMTTTAKKREKAAAKMIASEFHKQFVVAENEKVFSLAHSNNIFIKEDNNKPMPKLAQIDSLKHAMRLFFLALLVTSLVFSFGSYCLSFSDYTMLSQEITVVHSLDLLEFYFENQMHPLHAYNQGLVSVDNMTPQFLENAVRNIKQTFRQLEELKNSHELKRVLFDLIVNPHQVYGTTRSFEVEQNANSLNVKYDQTDFVAKLFQVGESINFDGFEGLTFEQKNPKFLQFYLTPSFESFISSIESNLLARLHYAVDENMKISIVIYVVMGAVCALSVSAAVVRITKIVGSFVSIISVFTSFNQQDIEKIYYYANFISNFFKYLRKRDGESKAQENIQEDLEVSQIHQISLTFDGKIYETEHNNNININKKVKKIAVGSVLNVIRLKTYGLVLLTLMLFLAGGFVPLTLIRNRNQQFQFLIEAGAQHFRQCTILTRVQSAVNKKFADPVTYDQYFRQNYQVEIRSLSDLRNNNHQLKQGSWHSSFVDAYNAVYFENVCVYLITDDADDLKQCQTATVHSLQFGIQSYIYEFSDTALKFLNNTRQISYASIFEWQQGLKYVNRFVTKLAEMWLLEYQQAVASARSAIVVWVIGTTLGLAAAWLVLFELLTIRSLNLEYETFMSVYDIYMPDYLVTKEKIIKAKLVTDGILGK